MVNIRRHMICFVSFSILEGNNGVHTIELFFSKSRTRIQNFGDFSPVDLWNAIVAHIKFNIMHQGTFYVNILYIEMWPNYVDIYFVGLWLNAYNL